jgi:hypothetical protein
MTAGFVFSLANMLALASWVLLGLAIILKKPWLRDQLTGRWIPLALSALYAALIVLFFGSGEGGFNSLADVQKLFTFEWIALAGWVHYLAFDLFIGAWIAQRFAAENLPRWPLILILPLTFMLGPMGFLLAEIARAALRPSTTV